MSVQASAGCPPVLCRCPADSLQMVFPGGAPAEHLHGIWGASGNDLQMPLQESQTDFPEKKIAQCPKTSYSKLKAPGNASITSAPITRNISLRWPTGLKIGGIGQ